MGVLQSYEQLLGFEVLAPLKEVLWSFLGVFEIKKHESSDRDCERNGLDKHRDPELVSEHRLLIIVDPLGAFERVGYDLGVELAEQNSGLEVGDESAAKRGGRDLVDWVNEF